MPSNDVAYADFYEEIGPEADSGGFTVLSPGTYPFTIDEPIERERFSGSAKMPECWKAVVKLNVDGGPLGRAKVFYNLFLTKGQAWKIKQLFVGVGLVDPNAEKFAPPWDKLPGTSGVAKIKNREYNGNTYNDVDSILSPAEGADAIGKAIAAEAAATSPVDPQTSMFNYPK